MVKSKEERPVKVSILLNQSRKKKCEANNKIVLKSSHLFTLPFFKSKGGNSYNQKSLKFKVPSPPTWENYKGF